MKRIVVSMCSGMLLMFYCSTASWAGTAETAKYVFFFLGDGMGSAQIQAAEAYLTAKNVGEQATVKDRQRQENRLSFTLFPSVGIQNTYSTSLITDSAAAVTAFACGSKTDNGIIGIDATRTNKLVSIARLAKEKGRRVGIVSSVSLNHATPAGYYANVLHRSQTNRIASQLPLSNFDFFGGGGLETPQSAANERDSTIDVWQLLHDHGYTVFNTRESIFGLSTNPQKRVLVSVPRLADEATMPFAIDRQENDLTLADITTAAIDSLSRAPLSPEEAENGFFLMVEGGKIDWACHVNDAATAIGEILDFDQAIRVARAFYNQHPAETLIVVTGDHETGGMSIGTTSTGYSAYPQRLFQQKGSVVQFNEIFWKQHKQKLKTGYDGTADDNLAHDQDMLATIKEYFGLRWADLDDRQQMQLEVAYDLSIAGKNHKTKTENTLHYGGHDPILVALSHILDEQSGIGWTTFSHTGTPVPVFAVGQQSGTFEGFMDNTEIAQKLAHSMGISDTLPVVRGNYW